VKSRIFDDVAERLISPQFLPGFLPQDRLNFAQIRSARFAFDACSLASSL
jgi:hypothetical protein